MLRRIPFPKLCSKYNPRIPGLPLNRSEKEQSSLFGGRPGSPENVSCSRATPRLQQCKSGVALEQEDISGFRAFPQKTTLCVNSQYLNCETQTPFLANLTRFFRDALKGTNLRGQTPTCGFLRVPAVFCGFLRKSAVSCENLRFPDALFSSKRRESAKICENLRLGSVCSLGFVPLSEP